ncbi:hypothetical protein TMatcc_008097 [Talaromyces marneffei ATCC 18224]|uniref:Uncharacterized protein n=1 Tax=Talaromyces marneffei (strain ATCC 18224 / CBS 334.59 / QM 7333) TaxID=441960 RepID=B6QEM3_TALMQ|nr:uncharacterized protein EYB26_004993 [Talaromyces marneffei]EEA24997.1 hypothetical protein PMAA_089640 [Talaromyces marneffei ATCC 18224]KAE8552539.1 hypothetical protein EYB25_003917 [Talaromyces marneffei]QGA17322.1 hypothetical protein EYB26_004993 [Talaromyces marneffei]
MSSGDKNQTILSRKRDWERWLRPIKRKALGTKEFTKPEVPNRLAHEKDEDLEFRRDIYKRAIKKYNSDKANIAAIREHIFRTIDQSATLLIENKSSVRDILSELQKCYKPDANFEQFDIQNEWTELKVGPDGKRQFNAWIRSWIETYNRARQYQLPGIGSDEKYAMIDFLLAIRHTHEIFYSTWLEAVINNREKSFIKLITKFEDFTKSERGRSIYANDSNQGDSNNNKPRRCWCGELRSVHNRWEKCAYLNEQIRDDNWIPDPKIIKKVAEAAASRKSLKDFIDQHKKSAEHPPVTINTVFRATSDIDSLVNSVIHNGGATESISNNINRIEDFVPERIRITAFGRHLWAEGRCTMVVWATAPGEKEKSQKLRIRNALYCPDCPISLISGTALNRSGVFRNEETNTLYSRKERYRVTAKLQLINGQAVIEYNPPTQIPTTRSNHVILI